MITIKAYKEKKMFNKVESGMFVNSKSYLKIAFFVFLLSNVLHSSSLFELAKFIISAAACVGIVNYSCAFYLSLKNKKTYFLNFAEYISDVITYPLASVMLGMIMMNDFHCDIQAYALYLYACLMFLFSVRYWK